MSYILNEAGVIVPFMSGKTREGADRRHYFYRVRDVISFLKVIWGAPPNRCLSAEWWRLTGGQTWSCPFRGAWVE
ncbi:hypothetical protein SB394_01860 [Burkholderia sp. BCCIQ04A]|nr:MULTISPECIES: hypothetical protein [Burkholderia]MEB2533116.1 hypothetical protein [Burkholderia anthinoferrum]MEB2563437.1 hypothetical protein [Burkholderia anthinoferrum]MEB2632471.1 hypothetical protein [Burkholderia anthinoferrum]